MNKNLLASLFLTVTVAASALWTPSARAHDDHTKAQYGGVVVEGGKFQAELVVTNDNLTVYITEHGANVPTKGATGKVTVLTEGKKSEFALVASGENMLIASLPSNDDKTPAVSEGSRVVAVITLAGKAANSVRWVIK